MNCRCPRCKAPCVIHDPKAAEPHQCEACGARFRVQPRPAGKPKESPAPAAHASAPVAPSPHIPPSPVSKPIGAGWLAAGAFIGIIVISLGVWIGVRLAGIQPARSHAETPPVNTETTDASASLNSASTQTPPPPEQAAETQTVNPARASRDTLVAKGLRPMGPPLQTASNAHELPERIFVCGQAEILETRVSGSDRGADLIVGWGFIPASREVYYAEKANGMLNVFDADTMEPARSYAVFNEKTESRCYAITYSKYLNQIVVVIHGGIRYYDFKTGRLEREAKFAPEFEPQNCQFHPAGKYLIAQVKGQKEIQYYNLENNRIDKTIPIAEYSAPLSFSPRGTYLVAGRLIFQTKTGQVVQTLPETHANAVAFNQSETEVAYLRSSGMAYDLCVASTGNMASERILAKSIHEAKFLFFMPDDSGIVNDLFFVNRLTGERSKESPAGERPGFAVMVDEEKTAAWFLSSSKFRRISLSHPLSPAQMPQKIESVTFDSDGHHLLFHTDTSSIRWNLATQSIEDYVPASEQYKSLRMPMEGSRVFVKGWKNCYFAELDSPETPMIILPFSPKELIGTAWVGGGTGLLVATNSKSGKQLQLFTNRAEPEFEFELPASIILEAKNLFPLSDNQHVFVHLANRNSVRMLDLRSRHIEQDTSVIGDRMMLTEGGEALAVLSSDSIPLLRPNQPLTFISLMSRPHAVDYYGRAFLALDPTGTTIQIKTEIEQIGSAPGSTDTMRIEQVFGLTYDGQYAVCEYSSGKKHGAVLIRCQYDKK